MLRSALLRRLPAGVAAAAAAAAVNSSWCDEQRKRGRLRSQPSEGVGRRTLIRCAGGEAELAQNYEVQERLGHGGFATVRRAFHRATGLPRALKTVLRAGGRTLTLPLPLTATPTSYPSRNPYSDPQPTTLSLTPAPMTRRCCAWAGSSSTSRRRAARSHTRSRSRLPISPYISPYLTASPSISLYLTRSRGAGAH